ncbi:hypothetical protein CsSME_00008671 [Camellia sinensis var. sinensis]
MIEEATRTKGVNFVIINPLGGVKVLGWWLETGFDEVYEWHCREFTLSRRVWMAIKGVPLNAWNSTTFTKIASNWGRVFSVDGKTSSRMELERGKVLVETNFKNSINGFCKLKVGQFLYDIRVSKMEFQKIYMLGSSYYPKAAVKVNEGIDESNSIEGFLNDGDHINVGEDVSVCSGNVLQGTVLATLLSQVEDSFDVTRSINGTDLRTLKADTESDALCSFSSHPMLSQNQVRKSLSPNHASYPNHLNPTQALIFPQKNQRKKLSLLELGLPHKFLNKGRYAKGSNKKSKDAKLVRSSTIRVCNKRFLNKLVESDEEMEQ